MSDGAPTRYPLPKRERGSQLKPSLKKRKKKESAGKPGFVEDNHSSGIRVAAYLKRPTRKPVWAIRAALRPRASLFGLAPGGVCRATECYHRRGALLPHHFTLTGIICMTLRRFIFCCTFRGLAPPRRYLAPCPGSPDFPPRLRAAVVWPTPTPSYTVSLLGRGFTDSPSRTPRGRGLLILTLHRPAMLRSSRPSAPPAHTAPPSSPP